MAAVAGSPRRHTRTPGRPSRTPGRPSRTPSASLAQSELPHKNRKYIPGGPGGGGRYIDSEGQEIAVGGTGPGGYAYTGPRGSVGRMNMEKGFDTPAPSTLSPSITRTASYTRPRRDREPPSSPRTVTRPRFSNAAAAAAASQASDGYKPREERSWEEFHPDLDIDAELLMFTADEVDGRTGKISPKVLQQIPKSPGSDSGKPVVIGDVKEGNGDSQPQLVVVTPKRKPGRPPRRPESMLSGLGSPPAPRIMPLPTHNPKERLNLPKASFRNVEPFLKYEEDRGVQVNYVDRSMASVGYQETDRWELPSQTLVRLGEGPYEDDAEVGLTLESDEVPPPAAPAVGHVEYDMDEQDNLWLDDLNTQRKADQLEAIKPAIFEITMTQIEKEYHALEKRIPKPNPRHPQTHRPRSSSQAAVNGDPNPPGDEPDSKCAICDDGDCENANAIIFCDGCDLAVHQECYGVPFIPEGQWFCRKCKEIGRGTPTCIFCPNVDGAFKQTNTLRWSHLLCAIWIPEVTVANMTFMEPITDVDKVPKPRWKLTCYICQQRMGACIQCGNKACYQAFHVTCARRARLFLKMKSQHQGGIDASVLKAFCDRHVPPDWRRDHNVDEATVDAKRWYRHAMKDRKWADSQSAAVGLGAPPPPDGGMQSIETAPADDNTIVVASNKRKRNQQQKLSWRLPSGAPIVPQVVFNTVEASLARFTIRKRKEFVEKACRYWTLKREARRGAALLKRLQLQLESFSSMEITRRNFAGMGAVGRPRLQRRIEFAEMLQRDIAHLTVMCRQVREREELKLKDIELLRELVDTVYFPIPPLLWPILQRAQKLDEKTKVFKPGFDALALKLRQRFYISVSDFSRDIGLVFSDVLNASETLHDPATTSADILAIHDQLNEIKPGTSEHLSLTQEQKDLKRLAKRIVKAVKEPLEEAMKKEAELRQQSYEDALKRLEGSGGLFDPRADGLSMLERIDEEPKHRELVILNGKKRSASKTSAVGGASPADHEGDVAMLDADERTAEAVIHLNIAGKEDTVPIVPNNKHTPASKAGSCPSSMHAHTNTAVASSEKPTEPLSPPISTSSFAQQNGKQASTADTAAESTENPHKPQDSFEGGTPWYFKPWNITGTTVHDERYTGREVLRDMSEELSDMDEDTLVEIGAEVATATPEAKGGIGQVNGVDAVHGSAAKKAVAVTKPKKKRAKKNMWSKAR